MTPCPNCGQPTDVLQQCETCPRQFVGAYCGHQRGTCPDCGGVGGPVPNNAPKASPVAVNGLARPTEGGGGSPPAEGPAEGAVALTLGEWHAVFGELAAIRRGLEGGDLLGELRQVGPLFAELAGELPDVKLALIATNRQLGEVLDQVTEMKLELAQVRADVGRVHAEVMELAAKVAPPLPAPPQGSWPVPDESEAPPDTTTPAPVDTAGG